MDGTARQSLPFARSVSADLECLAFAGRCDVVLGDVVLATALAGAELKLLFLAATRSTPVCAGPGWSMPFLATLGLAAEGMRANQTRPTEVRWF